MSVAELAKLTGLKTQYAQECFDLFGGFDPALASFAQSLPQLGPECFDDATAVKTNAAAINGRLRAIYARARKVREAAQAKDAKSVWQAYKTSPLPPAEAAPAKAAAPQPAAAPAAAAPAAAAAAAAPSPAANPFANAFANASTATFSFGGAAPAKAAGAPAASPALAFAAPAPVAEEPKKKAEVKYCDPKHFTGCYFDMPDFWKTEVEAGAALLDLDKGYLAKHKDELRPMMLRWVKKASFHAHPVKYVVIDDEDEEVVRVIIKDADRTFFESDHRQKLVCFLNAMYHELGAYGQAMSYLAGICLLALTEEETAAVLRFVSKTYIKGHWAAEAVGFATSAWVAESFMQRLYPDVAEHLQKINIWPDTYLQKIMSGLCIHMLPFSDLFPFLDEFMEGGLPYLIKFSLAIVEHFRGDVLKLKSNADASTLYEIMRLDPAVADASDVAAIRKRARTIELDMGERGLDEIRSQVYTDKVEPRIKRAPKTDTFEPCELCNVNRPKWWCDNIGGAVCTACKEKNPDETYEPY